VLPMRSRADLRGRSRDSMCTMRGLVLRARTYPGPPPKGHDQNRDTTPVLNRVLFSIAFAIRRLAPVNRGALVKTFQLIPLLCLALLACVTPLQDEQSTASCIQAALLNSGQATDIKVNPPSKFHGWTVTFKQLEPNGSQTEETIQVGRDLYTSRGLYYVATQTEATKRLLQRQCPGAAAIDESIVD
jgi:hypothetical protein